MAYPTNPTAEAATAPIEEPTALAPLQGVPTLAPQEHPSSAGHTLCLVLRVVYGASDTDSQVYLSAAVDHRLPQSVLPIPLTQLTDIPSELLAVGHAALVQFAEQRTPPPAPAKSARAKTPVAVKVAPKTPEAPQVAGPRPTTVAPLAPSEVQQAEQLNLFAEVAATATPPASPKEG